MRSGTQTRTARLIHKYEDQRVHGEPVATREHQSFSGYGRSNSEARHGRTESHRIAAGLSWHGRQE